MSDKNQPNVENVPAPGEDSHLPEPTLETQLATVTAERDQLLAEKADLNDRLLRRTAEFDNFRRRTEKERSDYLQFASMEVVRDVLPVLDDFERALAVETGDSEYCRGMQMIHQRLYHVLRKLGLEPIEAKGKLFDPHHHEAVERVHTEEVPDQTVLDELRRGYNFKGKLLRPAMVRVAVRP